MTNRIQKITSPGDIIFSVNGGVPLKVKEVTAFGLKTEEDFFFYEEHGQLFFLTERGYKDFKNSKENKYAIKK